jgi:LmbE family N-acetylglucosaminyl deacetylase
MQRAWDTFGPFDPALIHIAMAKAIIRNKHDQHITFYLDHIIQTHIDHQQQEKNS